MRMIRAGAYRRMRWKNGLGETAEIAIAPEGAALDQFDWRISMARIEAPGPFSIFPGIDRTLTVLEGEGLALALRGQPAVELTPRSAPFPFAGDTAAAATLLGGAVTDLNVMTRRSGFWHRVTRVEATGRQALGAATTAVVTLCAAGPVRVRSAGTEVELGTLDALLIDHPGAELEVAGAVCGSVLLIEIGPR